MELKVLSVDSPLKKLQLRAIFSFVAIFLVEIGQFIYMTRWQSNRVRQQDVALCNWALFCLLQPNSSGMRSCFYVPCNHNIAGNEQ
jgi:hypothetical protein